MGMCDVGVNADILRATAAWRGQDTTLRSPFSSLVEGLRGETGLQTWAANASVPPSQTELS